jgi:hypothetical protein
MMATTMVYEYPLIFDEISVRAGERAKLRATPGIDYKITRLLVPETIGTGFVIEEVQINTANVLSKAKPAMVFGEFAEPFEALREIARWPVARRNLPVYLVVLNMSRKTVKFKAALIGTRARGLAMMNVSERRTW